MSYTQASTTVKFPDSNHLDGCAFQIKYVAARDFDFDEKGAVSYLIKEVFPSEMLKHYAYDKNGAEGKRHQVLKFLVSVLFLS